MSKAKALKGHLSPYVVTKGKRFSLKDCDTDPRGWKMSKEEMEEALQKGVVRLGELQERLYAQDQWGVLLIFQAMDAAGKDGAIKHVMSGVNPQGCQVYSFKTPSPEELDHDFLWRTSRAPPSAAASASSTARTTRRCWWSGSTRSSSRQQKLPPDWSRSDIWKERFEDINLRALPGAQRHRDPQVLPARVEEGAEASGSSSGSTSRRRTGSSRWPTCTERRHWEEYMEAYEDMIRHRDRAGAVDRRARRQQVVYAAGGRRSGGRRARGPQPEIPRRLGRPEGGAGPRPPGTRAGVTKANKKRKSRAAGPSSWPFAPETPEIREKAVEIGVSGP